MRCKIIYLLAIISLLAVGCNEADDGNHVDPITLNEKIKGEWGLMNLKMVDEVAKAAKTEPSEQDLSTLFNYDNFRITFKVDENNLPTTYEVAGDVPPLFALNGYWSLSNDFQQANGEAVRIYLYSDAQKTMKTDELRLAAVPGSNEQMELHLVRVSGGIPFISYKFQLNAIN
ncbi:MAG: DUF5004 domain-containing protein [Flavobacterium psychrophilum]|nr:MAG: DUF5004 domain-containing protein [Flavobacterium psychrophilum]